LVTQLPFCTLIALRPVPKVRTIKMTDSTTVSSAAASQRKTFIAISQVVDNIFQQVGCRVDINLQQLAHRGGGFGLGLDHFEVGSQPLGEITAIPSVLEKESRARCMASRATVVVTPPLS
jgi:hypothetical protein